jgi:hypothetical protein
MDVRCKQEPRILNRCYQGCRCEDQLLILAYEQVCPQVRRLPPPSRAIEVDAEKRRSVAGRA